VAFRQAGDHLASVSVVPCDFMPLTGELAACDPVRPFGQLPGMSLSIEGDGEFDLAALRAALRQPRQLLPTGVTITPSYPYTGLGLWLVLHDPGVGELTAVGPAAGRIPVPAIITHIPGRASATVLADQTSLAAVARPPGAEQATAFECRVRGYGPDGDRLAERLAAAVRAWDSAGRPAGSALRIRAYPAGAGEHQRAAFTIVMPHTRFLLDW
jgi:protein-L-isoaspartate(D-aspartate) O-methyltransferase